MTSFITKSGGAGLASLGRIMVNLAEGLINGGRAQFSAGVDMLNSGGDSIMQAAVAGMGGISMCVGGVADVAMGLTILSIAYFMIGMGDTLEAGLGS